MAIPMAISGQPFMHRMLSCIWGRLGGGLLAAMHGHELAPGPSTAREGAGSTVCPAFTNLIAANRVPVLDYLYGMTRDRELAADLAKETFTRAFAAGPDLSGVTRPRTWLYGLATAVALTTTRRRRRFPWLRFSRLESHGGERVAELWDEPLPLAQTRRGLDADLAERDAVWSSLASLPPRCRAALLLQTTGDLEVGEIATVLRVSESTVQALLFRGKQRFRALDCQLQPNGVVR
jgi:RNA polymerase sigma-70 factor (ECF subfamily)